MTASPPLHLIPPTADGPTRGTLRYDARTDHYIIVTEDRAVREMAKRVFPGCAGPRDPAPRFKATKRACGELNWFMLRFPLRIEDAERFEADRQRAVQHALRRETNADLRPIEAPPGFTGKLYQPFQGEGADFLVKNERCLLADDMGIGKTVQALAALAEAKAFPALIVVPPNVQLQWQRQAGAFLRLPVPGTLLQDDPAHLAPILKGLTPYPLPESPLTIIHYGLLRGWKEALLEKPWQTVIFDEIQELRHTGTQKYTVASLLGESARNVWGLSGTPVYNYGDEIWSVLNILEYHCLGDRDSFTREWCTGYGNAVVADPKLLGDHLRTEGLMLRRRKVDVQGQLPPKRRAVITVEQDDSLYNKLIAEAVELAGRYESIKDWHEKGMVAREIEQAARQACGLAKAPFVAEFIRSLVEAGERPLVYAYHHSVHQALAEKLWDFDPVQVTGKQTDGQKQASVKAFASGESRVVQLSLRSSAGLDGLQGAGTCVVFAELDWSPAILTQCEDRLHRLGIDELMESLLCYYLVSDNGMDDTMREALGLKIGQITGILGDQAESQKDRALAQRDSQKHLARIIERLKARKAG